MGDVSAEPSMEDILSSIKRIIAEDVETGGASRARRRPTPQPTPVETAEDDDVLELSEAMPESDAPSITAPVAAATPAPAAPGEKIISDEAAEVSRARLASLSRLVIKPEVAGSDTLEGLVREMLKPMLRDWLDANLPDLVESMVAKEIARITGQR
jgi:cell pole-organizing protein PopZ